MNLFTPKTINKRIKNDVQIPTEHLKILTEWSDDIKSGRIYAFKETALHGEFTSKIVQGVLGYQGPSGNETYTVSTEEAILQGSVDLALGQFTATTSEIIAPFELKGAKTKDLDAIMPGRNKTPVQQAWEYATNQAGVKWVLVSNYVEIRLYGFGEGTSAYEAFYLADLINPQEYTRLMLLLAADNLLTGRTQALLEECRREDKDITDALYRDYKQLRSSLIQAIRETATAVPPLDAIAAAQKILDRVLFIAFAEDTGLLPQRILERAFDQKNEFNPKPVWENFKGLFAAIDKGNKTLDVPPYNGGLFAPDKFADQLILPDDVCEGFKKIGDYDFSSEVSVTVLGHIFEQSIADVERLQAVARGEEVEQEKKTGTSGRRKRDGVVYTPDYVARFIVEQTIGAHLQDMFAETFAPFITKDSSLTDYESIQWRKVSGELEAWESYRDRIKTLRIVDPACGSGVFLVMAFDYLKAELHRVNRKIVELRPKAAYDSGLFDFVPDSEILTNNLFGVDVNSESVEIAKLSLWVKTAQKGKALDSLDKNILVGDSLIEDSSFAYLEHGFSWKKSFPHVFKAGGFDVVLGNPPYVRMELIKQMKPYLKRRFEVYSGSADLYCYFYERGIKVLKPGGRLGYISSSSFFKSGFGQRLRNYLRNNASLESIVDFGDEQIFEGVTTYPVILVLRKSPPPKGHVIKFWNIAAPPEENFSAAFKKCAGTYNQSNLSEGSWELEKRALLEIRTKITNGKQTLEEVFGNPLYGIKTGYNPAFVVGEDQFSNMQLSDPKSAEIVRPLKIGDDLARWHSETTNQYLICSYGGVDIGAYPSVLMHLSEFRTALEPKPENWRPSDKQKKWPGRKAGTYKWYELQDSVKYHQKFAGPKIIYPEFSQGAKFSMDTSGSYLNNKCFFIESSDYALLAFLNSKCVWFFLAGLSAAQRGGEWRLELRKQYVSLIPVPAEILTRRSILESLALQCSQAARSRLQLQTALTRRIPDLCPPEREPKLTTRLKEWWTLPDFAAFRAEVKKVFKVDIPLAERSDWQDWITRDKAEIARLSAEIKQAEAEIDAIVYDLFDLTPEEIELLEANV